MGTAIMACAATLRPWAKDRCACARPDDRPVGCPCDDNGDEEVKEVKEEAENDDDEEDEEDEEDDEEKDEADRR